MSNKWWIGCILVAFCACAKIEIPDNPLPGTSKNQIEISDTLTLAEALERSVGEEVAVKGYMVGYCRGTSLSSATSELPHSPNTNFILYPHLPTEGDTDTPPFMVVGLNQNNAFHADWNFHAHPEKLGAYVLVYGKLQPYFGGKGIKEPKLIRPLTPPKDKAVKPIEPTENDTLTVAQSLALDINQFITLRGYIVGTIAGMSLRQAVFGVPESLPTNLLLADSKEEKDITKVLPIALKKDSRERTELNLVARPDLLGKEILVQGITTTYFTIRGIKDLTYYRLLDASPKEPTDPTPTDTALIVTPTISDSSAIVRQGRSKGGRVKNKSY